MSSEGGPQRVGSRVRGIVVLGAVAVLACLALGAWQLDRARTRDTPTTPGDPMAVTAVPLGEAVPADGRVGAGTPPRAVTLTGRYDRDHQFLVPGREQAGVAALYVVTPLVADGRGVLVARGWIPVESSQPQPAAPVPPYGTVTVTGWLVPSESLDAGSVDALTLPDGQVATLTAARLAGLLPYPIVDGYVGAVDEQVDPTSRPGGLPEPPDLERLVAPHVPAAVHWSAQSLFYAFEWWFFALVVVWMCVQAVSIERGRGGAEGVRADAAQPTGDVPAAPPAP